MLTTTENDIKSITILIKEKDLIPVKAILNFLKWNNGMGIPTNRRCVWVMGAFTENYFWNIPEPFISTSSLDSPNRNEAFV